MYNITSTTLYHRAKDTLKNIHLPNIQIVIFEYAYQQEANYET